jgi:hypothetical protein
MYTLKLLAPLVVAMCAEGLTTRQGDYCVLDNKPANVVKFYEPGKSCYVNGTFYSKCEDRLNGSI